MKTLSFEECCEKVAKKYSNDLNFNALLCFSVNHFVRGENKMPIEFAEEVAELYAKEVAKEAIRLARGVSDTRIGALNSNCPKYNTEEIINELFKQPKA